MFFSLNNSQIFLYEDFAMQITINDIASRLGISKSTVSKGLNNATDVSPETKRLILETAAEMGYINKRAHQNTRVCIIIENMDYTTPKQFGYDIVEGFKYLAKSERWVVDIVPVTMEFQKMHPYDVFMMQENYQASFVLGFSLLDPWINEFKISHFPTVLLDNYIKGNPNIASVGCDSVEGFDHAVKHLVDLGHTKIGLISGPLDSYIIKVRYQAYISALKKYGLELNDKFIGLGYYVSESTRTYITKLMDQGVTAILFSHDIRAVSAITECNGRNIRIPEELSIIGFDDLPIAEQSDPPLTTVQQDRTALGKCGYYAVSSLLNNVPIGSILLRAPLIVRNSTGRVRKDI